MPKGIMEKLEVKNFLVVRDAKIEARRFTLLIGPQANGKSVVAKLLYYFRTLLTKDFLKSIENQENKDGFERTCKESFEQIFPSYAWVNQAFTIRYKTPNVEFEISKKSVSSRSSALVFKYSPELLDLYNQSKRCYRKNLDVKDDVRAAHPSNAIFETYFDFILKSELAESFQNSIFIPASRSFFANLQKNVFSFLASNITIDPLIKNFGSVYQNAKNVRRLVSRERDDPRVVQLRKDLRTRFEKILSGRYLYEDEQDWIINDRRKVNVAHASSGQQEVLPMLLVLLNWVDRVSPNTRPMTFFIEEPEAHLFPVAQRSLIGIFSDIYDVFPCSFVLTTHSPYVLTALNNLILASNLEIKKLGPNSKIEKIIEPDRPVAFRDVSAYTMLDGVSKTILERKNALIGSSVIDSVSDEFDKVFEKLLQLYIGQK